MTEHTYVVGDCQFKVWASLGKCFFFFPCFLAAAFEYARAWPFCCSPRHLVDSFSDGGMQVVAAPLSLSLRTAEGGSHVFVGVGGCWILVVGHIRGWGRSW